MSGIGGIGASPIWHPPVTRQAAPSAVRQGENPDPNGNGSVPVSLDERGQDLLAPGSQKAEKDGGKGQFQREDCETCKNRKYQDGSDDPGVSFKTATKISPDEAASAVKSHEMEHVFRERGKAQREGREVVSQSVVIHTGICPECGRVYVSGGTTTTTTRKADENTAKLFDVGKEPEGAGRLDGAI